MTAVLTRRATLAAALILPVTAGARLLPAGPNGPHIPASPGETAADEPFAWLEIGREGVLIRCAKAEMGQGVTTALPQILAEELEVAWERVRVEHAPLGAAFVDPRLRERDTAGSRSVRMSYDPLRRTGAAAREMLVAAAAARWGAPAAECSARLPGEVVHSPSGRVLPYAELAADAARLPVPTQPALKPREAHRLIGRSLPRLDVPAKVTGRAIYAADVRLPGMLTATLMQCPAFGGRVARVDDSAVRRIPGVVDVAVFQDWVAVIAEGFWPAKQGLDALRVTWTGGSRLSSADISATLRALVADGAPALAVRREGDAAAALRGAARVLRAEYEVPYLHHATMEPMSAVARTSAEGVEIWAGVQRHSVTRDHLAELLGIAKDRVEIHTTYLGGGFGRRFETDFVAQAALLSRHAGGRPVKLLWTREEDTRHGFYRPATFNRLEGGLDTNGRLTAWTHRIAAQSLLARIRPYAIRPDGLDVSAVEGAANHPYAVPNVAVDWARAELSVPVGAWRSVGSSQNAFVTECFVDELAHAAGADPAAFRRGMLGAKPRHLGVLNLAAQKAGWGTPHPRGWHRGVAVAETFFGWCAQVVEVERIGDRVKPRRIVAALDCGLAVNPAIAAAQTESAIAYGLSAALSGEITLKDGAVEQANFDTHPVLRLDEMPAVEVHILPSNQPPGGVGEIGTPPTAPALVNAIFAATGRRIRSLPLARHAVI